MPHDDHFTTYIKTLVYKRGLYWTARKMHTSKSIRCCLMMTPLLLTLIRDVYSRHCTWRCNGSVTGSKFPGNIILMESVTDYPSANILRQSEAPVGLNLLHRRIPVLTVVFLCNTSHVTTTHAKRSSRHVTIIPASVIKVSFTRSPASHDLQRARSSSPLGHLSSAKMAAWGPLRREWSEKSWSQELPAASTLLLCIQNVWQAHCFW